MYLESHLYCKEITQRVAKSFYFASHVLPEEKRRAAYSIYAFCRFADDGIDLAKDFASQKAHLETCYTLLNRIYAHQLGRFVLPFEAAFEQTIARYDIPRTLFEDLLKGMIYDSQFNQPEDEADLLEYCYYVAGCVGLIMTYVFGARGDWQQPAQALGNAMQLTNIARDIREDAARGRVYLPESWLVDLGLSEEIILQLGQKDIPVGFPWERCLLAQGKLIGMAESQYRLAEPGIPLLTNDGSRFCVALMKETYQAILEKLRKSKVRGLQQRQSLNFIEKILRVPEALGDLR
ncbi:MAG: phytoene/squalene synthase family protein [Oligoflexia bacterium]|nr:phytoene/squalene synthase family protein [Oligoflexia bacterium]